MGIDASFGQIIGSIIEHEGSTAGKTAWIESIHTSCMYLFASISTVLSKKYGFFPVVVGGFVLSCTAYLCCGFTENVNILLLTYGVLGGAGSGLLFTPGQIICTYYFKKHRAIATGIATSGTSVGITCLSILSSYVNITYGTRYVFIAFCILSPLSLFVGVLAFPLENEDEDGNINNFDSDVKSLKLTKKNREGPQPPMSTLQYLENKPITGDDDAKHITTHEPKVEENQPAENARARLKSMLKSFKLLKDSRLAFYCIVHVMNYLAHYIPVTFLPELMVEDNGLPKSAAGTIMVAYGVANFGGNLMSGVIGKLFPNHTIIISAMNLICIASIDIGFSFCAKYEEFVGATIGYGFFMASIDVFCVYILIELYGTGDEFQEAYGVVMLARMTSPLWGPPIAGYLHDLFGFYYISFYAAATFVYIAALSNFMAFLMHRRRK